MFKTTTRVLGLILVLQGAAAWAGSDFLAQTKVTYQANDTDAVLNRTTQDLRSVLERYEPKVDSGSKIVSPIRVGGTQARPTIKVSIKKCVAFVCQVVDLDAEASLREVQGPCNRNFILDTDLSRSSKTLTDVYSVLRVSICYKKTAGNQAVLDLTGVAIQSPTYDTGFVQGEILKLLKLQVEPITKALKLGLRSNGASL